MLEKFKKELITTNLVFVGIVLFLMFAMLTFYSYRSYINDIERTLYGYTNNVEETNIKSIKFIFDKEGNIEKTIENGYFYNIGQMKEQAIKFKEERPRGTRSIEECDNYFYCVKIIGNNKTIVSFTASYFLYKNMRNMVVGYLCGYLLVMGVFYYISKYMSDKALKPVEDAWEQQKRFINDASHELKTPLAIISANNDILKRRKYSRIEDEIQWIESTGAEVAHMKQLVEEMLFLAKDEYVDFETTESLVNLSELVEEDVLSFEAIAFEKGIKVDYHIESSIYIEGSEIEFKKLGHIMLDNALKYSDVQNRQASIKVSLKVDDMVLLKIQNTSEIISKEELKNIFNRFYRANQTKKGEKHRGTGLGLAIAKSIVERHGGSITVNSGEHCGPDETQGTEFLMKFKKAVMK